MPYGKANVAPARGPHAKALTKSSTGPSKSLKPNLSLTISSLKWALVHDGRLPPNIVQQRGALGEVVVDGAKGDSPGRRRIAQQRGGIRSLGGQAA